MQFGLWPCEVQGTSEPTIEQRALSVLAQYLADRDARIGELEARLRVLADGLPPVSAELIASIESEPLDDVTFLPPGSLEDTASQLARVVGALEELQNPRPLDEWHDDYGSVLWWKLPVNEPPYVGTPGDSDWPGYHTHWTKCPELKETNHV
jgi:hypothetical protein